MNSSQLTQFESVKNELVQVLPRLLRYARNLCGTRADAEDLLQSTSERVLSRWQQFRPGTEFDRWAFTIMHSIRNNSLRSEAVRLGAGHVDASEALIAPESRSPERNKILQQVLDTVGQLPEAQRQVILLVYIEGYSYAEAAEILGVPQGTVMSRIGRARMKIANQHKLSEGNQSNGKVTASVARESTQGFNNSKKKSLMDKPGRRDIDSNSSTRRGLER